MQKKSSEIDCFDKNYFSVCMLEWLSCPLSSQLYDSVCSTHCTSSCTTQITGDHNVKTIQAYTDFTQHIAYVPVAGSGLFFQPCATCGSAVVSKRLQSALYAGAEALIQTANAPVSHRSLWRGRGRSGFMDLTQLCGASKAIGALQRTAGLLLRWNPGWLCHREHSSTRVLKVRLGCFISHTSSWMSVQSFSTSAWLNA